jgi:hypothetical protein
MAERREAGVGDLDRRLTELAPRVDYPTMTATAGAVGHRLREEEGAERLGRRNGAFAGRREGLPARWRAPWRPTWGLALQRVAIVIVSVTVVAVGILLASPAARSAVAGLLGLGGVEIQQVEQLPPVGDPANVRAHLGRRVTLDEARAQVQWAILVPADPALGEPDEVYLDSRVPGGVVSLLWNAKPGLPQASPAQAGLLLTEFAGSISDRVTAYKLIDRGARVEVVKVGQTTGLWVSGRPHAVELLDERDEFVEETLRLEGDVLLWTQRGLTLRIESALGRDASVAIADSIR